MMRNSGTKARLSKTVIGRKKDRSLALGPHRRWKRNSDEVVIILGSR
jgi:hypothetical protein